MEGFGFFVAALLRMTVWEGGSRTAPTDMSANGHGHVPSVDREWDGH